MAASPFLRCSSPWGSIVKIGANLNCDRRAKNSSKGNAPSPGGRCSIPVP
jgi:hypothetical protein